MVVDLHKEMVQGVREVQESLSGPEKEKEAEKVYLEYFERWWKGDDEQKGTLSRLDRMYENDRKFDDLTEEKQGRHLEDAIRFQSDYVRWMLSMPKSVKEGREFRDLMEHTVGAMTDSDKRWYIESRRIGGAVGVVTFLELVRAMGPEYEDLMLDDFELTIGADRISSTDFGVSVGGIIFQMQLKAVYNDFHLGEGMVQEIGDEHLRSGVFFGSADLKPDNVKQMLWLREDWVERERELFGDNARPVRTMAVFVPHMSHRLVGRWTGFLRDAPGVQAELNVLKEYFGGRMRAMGFEISSVDE